MNDSVTKEVDKATGRGHDDNDERPSLLAKSVDTVGDGNFPKGCEFSPDGLCLLTTTASDHRLRLYDTPPVGGMDPLKATPYPWQMSLSVDGGDSVRSYAWYPFMNSSDAGTCCFLSTSRDQPIHLYDAYTSRVRATYRPFNAKDEMESPTVVSFSPNGQHIYAAGFRTDRVIHVFDTTIPGRDSTVLRLGKTRRSTDGQKGLVSAMAFSPRTHNHVLCVGTYAPGSIYVYDERLFYGNPAGTVLHGGVCVVGHGASHSRKKHCFFVAPAAEDDDDERTGDIFSAGKVRWFQTRARGGVTQLSFSPNDDYVLYSGSRRSDAVLAWDLRMMSGNEDYMSCPIRGIASYATCSVTTNQRLEFDFDDHGRRLFVGGHDRCVRVYDVTSGKLLETLHGLEDVANGISYTSSGVLNSGLLAVAVGARRFPEYSDDEHEDDGCGGVVTNVPGSIQLYKV